ncbi:hypothetical protein KZ813_17490 [Sphingomonas sp. RHCKR7]|uniref:hypothetical protein n=1 Tax=Sphingomonas folli TaxID=2862497 RepID=UPI001CA4B4CB|nr:hypothetical protein [Sphingomonas folli]MBW6528638.1 hypothetical protein [Sphingomonas folli]
MFMDFRDQPPPPRWEPRPARPRLSPRQERWLGRLVLANMLLLLLAPIGGATLVDALITLFRR